MNKYEKEIYDKIVSANREYRNGTPVMTDIAYDALVDDLRKINPDHDWFKRVEPGMDGTAERKVKLPFPMKSLDKVKKIEDLMLWLKKTGLSGNELVTITPKYDGISLLCNEKTLMAYSRGGSENEGMNCQTHMIKMRNVSHNDEIPFTFGEAIFSKHNWQNFVKGEINPLTGQEYKSPRNTVAGLFRQDNPSNLIHLVDFIRYGSFGVDLKEFETYHNFLNKIEELYKKKSYHYSCKINNITEEKLDEAFYIWSDLYPIDGLVVYVDDINKWEDIGRHQSTGNPQWAIAYKPEKYCDNEITEVIEVNCKISKSGYLKPTVKVNPVELEGATVDNPTGYNASFCIKNGIGKGAIVRIIRSGMVIPKIIQTTSPVPEKEAYKPFSKCPTCGCETRWNDSMTDIMCTNPDCPGIAQAKMEYFCSKMDYENIGEEYLKSMFNSGINTPQKLIRIDRNSLVKIDGIGKDISDSILKKNKEILTNGVPIWKLVEASDCFNGIGEKKAKLMLSKLHPDTLKKWVSRSMDKDEFQRMIDSMSKINRVGEAMLVEFVNKHESFLDWLRDTGIPINFGNDSHKSGGIFSGQKVCFTGVRDKEAENFIVNNGGDIVSSVTKNTSLLIVKDRNNVSTKLSKAIALGVRIMDLDEFKEVNRLPM